MSGAQEASKRGRASRAKGRDGEQEVARLVRDLTGWDVRRRVRNHQGESDLTGVPGFAVEVKRHKTATRAQIRGWWAQAVAQAKGATPVLFFRQDRDEWRAVWPGAFHSPAAPDTGYLLSVEGSVYAWASAAREMVSGAPVSPEAAEAQGHRFPAAVEASA